jgi:hypothetical protein
MERTFLIGVILISLSSSTYAERAPKCNLKRYPNLACQSQFVRCTCPKNGKCHWIFGCN